MTTPARQHFIRHAAAAATVADDGRLRDDLNQYELHLAQLAEHKRRLKQIKSVQRKVEFKRDILPEYAPYVEGALAAATGQPDDVLTTLMVWSIDAGQFEQALAIGAYILEHHLPLPDQYKRDAACVLAEEIADQALAAAEPDTLLAVLNNTVQLVEGRDMPDQVSAKLHKALGYALRADGEPELALASLETALQFDSHIGVKKDIERLQRDIKNNAAGKDAS